MSDLSPISFFLFDTIYRRSAKAKIVDRICSPVIVDDDYKSLIDLIRQFVFSKHELFHAARWYERTLALSRNATTPERL